MHVQQAVVLVGGKGTRLGELTRTIPKPLLEIAPGRRFLDTLVFDLARHGFRDIILLAGHLGEQVEDAYDGRRVLESTVRVIREPTPQGTGGALLFAADQLDPWFLMTNGDSLFEINFRDLTAGLNAGPAGRLALREVPDPARYGAVTLEGDRISGFMEKNPDLRGPALINGGIYVFSREVLALVPGPCSIEQDVFPKLAAAGRLHGRRYDGYFLDIGLPDTYEQARAEIPQRSLRPCAFLDRDGVLNHDAGYTHRPQDLQWIDGAREAVRRLNDSGYYVVVVTNQAGVAKGFYAESDVHAFHAHMQAELAEAGGHFDAIYHCPFHSDAVVDAYRHPSHPDRKPNPGMIFRALNDLPIRREGSFLIGDKQDDIAAAEAAGIQRRWLFEGGSLLSVVETMLRSPV